MGEGQVCTKEGTKEVKADDGKKKSKGDCKRTALYTTYLSRKQRHNDHNSDDAADYQSRAKYPLLYS